MVNALPMMIWRFKFRLVLILYNMFLVTHYLGSEAIMPSSYLYIQITRFFIKDISGHFVVRCSIWGNCVSLLFCTLLFRGHHSWVECFFLEESPVKGVTLRVCGGWSSVLTLHDGIWCGYYGAERQRGAVGQMVPGRGSPALSTSEGDKQRRWHRAVSGECGLSRGLGRQSPASRECLHLRGRGHRALACADNVAASHRGYPLWLPLHCLQRFIAS